MEHVGCGDINCCWILWNSPERPGEETGGARDQRMNQDHPDHCTVKISILGTAMEIWRELFTLRVQQKIPFKIGVKNHWNDQSLLFDQENTQKNEQNRICQEECKSQMLDCLDNSNGSEWAGQCTLYIKCKNINLCRLSSNSKHHRELENWKARYIRFAGNFGMFL